MKFSQITLIAAALAWPAVAAVAAEPSENLNDLVTRATVKKCGSGQIAEDCQRWCGCAGKKGKTMWCDEEQVSLQTCTDIGCKCKN
ncbi:hypothetical protein DIS24_g12485 [Lasiodiplodia hormozganensis]|uniref:Uncharacterized protein n=1 Tax=Lasiodiplodia hormozganensis TaxID=869390 RepID=A0AA39WB59_9PEZI|nr:hypothetical protein DIS24_g12485 [Lasiodiplodia hormozganensis]